MRLFKGLLLLGLISLLTGCASVLTSYPQRMAPIKTSVEAKQYQVALKNLTAQHASQNLQLFGLEKGRIEQLAGDYQQSQQSYQTVIDTLKANQLKAKIEFKRLLESASSLLVNDRVIPYRLNGYEAVYLYTYQALNFLAQGDLTNALVLLRQGQNEQNFIKSQQYQQLLLADKKAKEEGWHLRDKKQAEYFKSTMKAAQGVKSSFENGLFYYLSALLFNAAGDQNQAFYAIKGALGVAPNNPYVQQLLLNILVARGGNQTETQKYLNNFGVKQAPVITPANGMVAVIFEQGFVPARQSVAVPAWIFGAAHGQILTLPIYAGTSTLPLQVEVEIDGHSEKMAMLSNTEALAAKALDEAYPLIVLRSLLRVIAKGAMAHEVEKHEGSAAGLMADIYNLVTSGADERSWLTLPHYDLIWQSSLPAGKHDLLIKSEGFKRTVSINLQAKETVLIWAVKLSHDLIIKVVPIRG